MRWITLEKPKSCDIIRERQISFPNEIPSSWNMRTYRYPELLNLDSSSKSRERRTKNWYRFLLFLHNLGISLASIVQWANDDEQLFDLISHCASRLWRDFCYMKQTNSGFDWWYFKTKKIYTPIIFKNGVILSLSCSRMKKSESNSKSYWTKTILNITINISLFTWNFIKFVEQNSGQICQRQFLVSIQ